MGKKTNSTSITTKAPSKKRKDKAKDGSRAEVEGLFSCTVCQSSRRRRASREIVFKTREHLRAHTVKQHPTTCLCCFETFDNSADLSEHVEANGHKMSVCDGCKSVFPDEAAMQGHECEASKESSNEAVPIHVPAATKNEEMSGDGESESDKDYLDSDTSDDDEEEDDSEYESEDSALNGYSSDELFEGSFTCPICSNAKIKSKSRLRDHIGNKHSNVCCICFKSFDNQESLNSHRTSMQHSWWKCTTCELVFIRKGLFQRHVCRLHREQCPLKCSLCSDFGTFSGRGLQRHIQRKHSKTEKTGSVKNELLQKLWSIPTSVCLICYLPFGSRYAFDLHMYRNHSVPRQSHIFKCDLCNLGFKMARTFERHLKEYHSEDEDYLKEARQLLLNMVEASKTCEGCSKLYDPYQLRRHMLKKHPALRPHKCDSCGDRFREEGDLAFHKFREHDGPNSNVCPLCGSPQEEKSSLDLHLQRVHSYIPMPTIYCFTHKKGFLNGSKLRSHLKKVHSEDARDPESPFVCDICGLQMEWKYSIKHVRAHRLEEPSKCKECGATFKRKDGLSNHMKKHTDEFQCKICGKNFEVKQLLERHAVVHSGEKPFKCELCGLRVSQKSALQRHVKVVHKSGTIVETGRRPSVRRTRGPTSNSKTRKWFTDEEEEKEEEMEEDEEESALYLKTAAELHSNLLKPVRASRKRKRSLEMEKEDELAPGVLEAANEEVGVKNTLSLTGEWLKIRTPVE